ncbi:Tastin like [Actinidia chinensis var. chinensis]|uniref:Tastin like n=1 Tax=Actinidia chinensis var. chinensis TaxID=1590841 RepID=A0A2R6P690_ACTCC|nr:Tastin like [Actinidia chinensis var. chinensis]
MEALSASVYTGLKRFWRRRSYNRLYATGRRRMNRAELGRAGSNRRRRFWRIKITPRLRFSPKKFLLGLRDAYVNFMLRIADSPAIKGGYGVPVGDGFGRVPLKEYDEKMIVEIYKSLLVARDAAKIGTQIACRP